MPQKLPTRPTPQVISTSEAMSISTPRFSPRKSRRSSWSRHDRATHSLADLDRQRYSGATHESFLPPVIRRTGVLATVGLLLASLAVVGVTAVLLIGSAGPVAPQKRPETGPSVAVELTALHKGSLPRIITAHGMVGTGPAAQQTIQAPVAAIVDAIYVKPGEQVAAHAPLLRIGPSPTTAASYTQAVTALQAANEEVQRTRTLLGQHLATRQQLATPRKRPPTRRPRLPR